MTESYNMTFEKLELIQLYRKWFFLRLRTSSNVENSRYVDALKKYFKNRLCLVQNMKLFRRHPFKNNNYMIYITEKSLMKFQSDGYIETFPNSKTSNLGRAKYLGVLANYSCNLLEGKPTHSIT